MNNAYAIRRLKAEGNKKGVFAVAFIGDGMHAVKAQDEADARRRLGVLKRAYKGKAATFTIISY
jgi:hypothetical protein